jgi:hypothetical protein
MSTELAPSPQCRVCGQSVAAAACTCASCQTPAHAECFAYAGGCSIFGCGSIGATFAGEVPAGWRESSVPAPGTWLIPADAVPTPGKGRVVDRALNDCFQHWRTTAQMELFSCLGQTWFSGVVLVMALTGKWTLNGGFLAALAVVMLAHANTLIGLLRLAFILTSPDGDTPQERPRRAVAARTSAIEWSRRFHVTAAAVLLAGLALGPSTTPAWALWAAVFAVMVPWFSLAPRWGMELPLLEAARAPQVTAA